MRHIGGWRDVTLRCVQNLDNVVAFPHALEDCHGIICASFGCGFDRSNDTLVDFDCCFFGGSDPGVDVRCGLGALLTLAASDEE
jgi:hypothetical protein